MKRNARTTKGGFGLLAMLLVLAAALTLPGHAMADAGVRCAPTGIEGVATDRYAYQGGETAFITGSGYAPGCDILVRITRPDGVVETAPVTTDLSGAFSHEYVLPGPPNLSGEFLLEVVGFGETVLASTEFADALAIATYITPTYVAGSQTLTFRALVRNTSNDTPIRQINIALPGPPTAYAAKSVANAIFSSGAGTFVMAATPASGFDFTFTATTGNSLALSTGWARFEITATTPALSSGTNARWNFEACANVGCGGAGSTRAADDPVVLVNPIPPANRYTADFRTAADAVTAPALTNGVAATLRLRITSSAGANNSSRHLTIALPRCFSSPTAVTVTGGSGYDPPAVRDGFIILSGGSVGSVGSFVTVQFTSTPSGCATGAQAVESAVGSNPPGPAKNTDHVVARDGNDPVVTFNSPPVANNDAYSVNEDNALTKNAADGVLANDTDADGHTLTAEFITGPANGTLTLNANGSFTYTPNADFFGSDSFTYRANDGFQTSNTATVGITVTAVNDAPSFTKGADVTVAEDSGAYTEAGWATAILAGPANESGQAVSFVVTGNTNAGLFSAGPAVSSNGTLTFTPAANAFGTATITLKANDSGGTANGGVAESAAQTFSITVTAVDDAPAAVDDAATVGEDSGANGVDVLANDTDIDGGPKSVASVTQGADGSVAITDGGSGVSYTPNADYCGSDTFTYTLNGGSTAAVSITVTCVDDAPAAVDDAATVGEDSGANGVDVLANDTDIDGGPKSVASVTQGADGSVAITDGGSGVSYTPNADYCGPDSFIYTLNGDSTATVTVDVECVNDGPVGVDDAASGTEDTDVIIDPADLLANDTDIDAGDTLSVTAVGSASGGSVELEEGEVVFSPAANLCGEDVASFEYTVSDGGLTDTATVTISLACVNDAPVAENDTASGTEDTDLVIDPADLLANDTDVDSATLSVTDIGNASAGTVDFNGDGEIVFSPAANLCGEDVASFEYTVSDGELTDTATVTISLTCVNDAPVANDDIASGTEDADVVIDPADLLANDTDVDAGDTLSVTAVGSASGGSVELDEGEVIFSPAANLCGEDVASFEYTVSDGELTDTATVTISLTCVNDAPVANDDTASGTEDTDVAIDPADLLANDNDVDAGHTLSVTAVGSASGGSVELDKGEIVFSPAANLCGEDVASFEYTVSDGELTDTATVTISLTCVNDAPEVTADSASVTVDEGDTALNSGTWTDVEDDEVTLTASVGTVTKHEDGTWSWSHATSDGPAESATVTITANDGEDTGSVTFALTVENVAPTATFNAPESVNEGSAINLSLSDVVDPGSADTHEYRFSCDGGAAWTTWGNSTHACEATDDGSVDVRGQVRDDDGGTSEAYSDSVTVNNVAPSATFTDNGPVDEGSNISVSLTAVVDPGSADTHEFRFSCDNGATWTDWGSSATHNCSTTDSGTRNVKGQVRDDDGGTSEEYASSVTIDNVAPIATLVAPETVDEGSNISVSLTDPSDPSSVDTAAGFQFRFSCDGAATWTPWSPDNTHGCSTDDNGTKNVEGEIRDKDGGTGTYSDSVTVKNVAPTATFNAPTSVNEGSPIAISLTSPSDPSSADTSAGFHYAFDCGDGSGYGAYSSTNTRSCPTSDNGTRTVGGRIKDKDGGVRQYTASVTVNNGPPTLTSLTPSSYLVLKGTAASVTGTYTDPGTSDTFTCVVNWDEPTGTPENTAGGANSCSASHTYTVQGTYTISMKVRDDDGGESNTMTVIVTVYDPGAGGFVTGGGWITSPKGSYAGDLEASGRANFGFTSQYKKGASIPTGETEFQLHFATFNFHSEAYEVLVVSGYKAQYRGTGKVNGVTGYRFVLTAYDGQITGGGGTDRFRIKITRITDGVVVYDTKMGVSEDMDLADPLALGGGSIVIHKAK